MTAAAGSDQRQERLTRLGFRFGINGPHAARTMMLDDLRTLLAHTPAAASRQAYATAIVTDNLLGKSTKKARALSLKHLAALYGLDAANPLFRALRRLWSLDAAAQPLLALTVALARDPLLRASGAFVLSRPVGVLVLPEDWAAFLADAFPDRFSAASLKSFSRNLAGTWTAAGFLQGYRRRTRSLPKVQPEVVALSLFLGHLEGRSGQRLFSSEWMTLLGGIPAELEALTNAAANRGLLVFMNAGGVQEVRFPNYLTPEEDQIRQEAAHVV
ncbi:hypothetical protein [uncultured Lamprocystis sp.]|uniref:hypothetical protein n=2 Tax=uncultured Lamprocystis sp. TaxID=543132 RepID=UPI0025D92810|nr:hypothetical protein [uncultured Lamprocystis sp.]